MFVMVFAICLQVLMWPTLLPVGAHPLGFVTLYPFRVYPLQTYVPSGTGSMAYARVHWVAAPSTAFSRGKPPATQLVLQPFNSVGLGIQLRGLAESHPIPLPFIHGGVSSFLGSFHLMTCLLPNLVSMKPGDSSMVIGYQVDEFTQN